MTGCALQLINNKYADLVAANGLPQTLKQRLESRLFLSEQYLLILKTSFNKSFLSKYSTLHSKPFNLLSNPPSNSIPPNYICLFTFT